MKFPFFASFVIFIFVLQHNMRKNQKKQEQDESSFWKRESSANDVRKRSLEDLNYVTFSAESFYPLALLDHNTCGEFLQKNPEVKEILSRFLFLENQKMVNLTEFSNTDLKFKYGVANLNTLTEYDTNYNEFITLLHTYGNIFMNNGYSSQALRIFEYAISIGSDISATYTSCALLYQQQEQWDKLEFLKKEAEKISTSRKDSILRKLKELYPDTPC